MKILVINGSPKGKYSITLQTILYLEKIYPQHEFTFLHVGQTIRKLERDFTEAAQLFAEAELVIFSYPVYTFLVPSQLHRFIELVKMHQLESGKEHSIDLTGKFVTQFSTSKHFYDVTAHQFIQDNCNDLGMKYITGLSADMDDLLTEKGQQQAKDFLAYAQWCVDNDHYEPGNGGKLPDKKSTCVQTRSMHIVEEAAADKPGNVVIITDCGEEESALSDMITAFGQELNRKSRIVNIREFPFKGGCLGCFHCAVSGACIYTDGFDEFLRNEIQTAEAIVFAFTIKDHSMGSRFKMYDDRQFCNGHRTVTMGMPMGYLIHGSYSAEPNLKMVIEARAQVGGNYLAGVATDETDPDREIRQLAQTISYTLEHSYLPPQNFYGVGGMKIFRDLIYTMRGMMKADHAFYKAHHQYDFPQKKKGTILKMYAVGALLSSPKIQAKMGNSMNEGMIAPYRKVIDQNEISKGV